MSETNHGSVTGVSDATDSLKSEFLALLESINAEYICKDCETVVIARDGSIWSFTGPVLLRPAEKG